MALKESPSAALATCAAFYAGRYLARHGYGRDRLGVAAGFTMAADRPARPRLAAYRCRSRPGHGSSGCRSGSRWRWSW